MQPLNRALVPAKAKAFRVLLQPTARDAAVAAAPTLPCVITLVTLRRGFPALFPSLAPQSNYVGNGCSCSLASFQPF